MLLNCGAGEDSWVPWSARRSNQSILKEIGPEYLLEGLMLKLKLQYFGHLIRRTDSLEKTLMLRKTEGRRRRRRQRMRWLYASLTQWTWIWTSSGGWTELQRVGHDWVTELNWRGKQHRWRLYDSREYDLVPRNEVPVLMGVRQRGGVVRLGWEIPRD